MKIISLSIILTFALNTFSQGLNNLWLMGYDSWAGQPFGGTKLDFMGGALNITYENRKMNFKACNGVISDKDGNLLFSSNGVFIANAENDTMLNGSGLNPGLYTTTHDSDGLSIPQGNLIIPFPDDSLRYYLFHGTVDDYQITNAAFHLYYSIIDMSLDSGRGAVTQKNQILFSDTLICGRLSACKHANGRDWWIIFHKTFSNRYFKFLVTPSGFMGPFNQDIGSVRDQVFSQCAFSPNGKYFAFYEASLGDLDILSFDRCTGDFSNLIHVDINDSALGGGVAFSPNSHVLYVSSQNYVYQFDLTAGNIPNTMTTVAVYDGFFSPTPPFATLFYLAQLAPDGKIYIICANSTVDIHVIEEPDSLGLACNVCQHCVPLPSFNSFTIPNYPNYVLEAEGGTVCDSLPTIIESSHSLEAIKFECYPTIINNNQITLVYSSLKKVGKISIYNTDGKKIKEYLLPIWSSTQKIILPDLNQGLYIVKLETEGHAASVKFLVE